MRAFSLAGRQHAVRSNIQPEHCSMSLSCGCAVTSTFSNLACPSVVLNISLPSPDLISPMHPSENNNVLKWQDGAREFPFRSLTVWLNSTCPKVNSYFPVVQLPLPMYWQIIQVTQTHYFRNIYHIHSRGGVFFDVSLMAKFSSMCLLLAVTMPLSPHICIPIAASSLVPTLPGATLRAVILYTVAKCIFFKCYFDYVIPHLPLSFLG